MTSPIEMPRPFSRRWIAWRLVQLAHKIYDAEYFERLAVYEPDGKLIVEWEVIGDLYGAGVSTQHAPGNDRYKVVFDDDYLPDWVIEQRCEDVGNNCVLALGHEEDHVPRQTG